MKYSIVAVLLCSFIFGLSFHCGAQSNDDLTVGTVYPGYTERIEGEEAGFHSSHPYVNQSLVVRCDGDSNVIAWKTAEIPSGYKGRYIYFAWYAGLATGKGRQSSSYEVSINGNKTFILEIKPSQFPQRWTLNGADGQTLRFMQHSLDTNNDCFGFMYLKIPADKYKKGSPIEVKVRGLNTKRYDDWYMTFREEVKEEVSSILARPMLRKNKDISEQLISVQVNHILPHETTAIVTTDARSGKQVKLKPGYNEVEIWVPAVKTAKQIVVKLDAAGILNASKKITLSPVAKRELYLVNHSHNDIGYSDYQPVVAKKQNDYIRQAFQLIEKTKAYPKNARFIWNVEAMWAVENFLKESTIEEKELFIKYARNGSIGLPAGYANLLTGICRPEELIHLTDYSNILERDYGLHSKTLMISDVPGMSWNIVSALAQRGVRYISSGPNYIPQPGFPDTGGRVGATHRSWGDKPFYWVSASGKDTVLYWQAATGYSWFQDWNMGRLRFEPKPMNQLLDYLQKLQDQKYPYDMVQLRYSIINDNSRPDDQIADIVKTWNSKYESPKLVITTAEDMMRTFENRYARKIPVVAGDFTPYWEDGAMSTAREEVLVKRSVERLYQSEVLNTLMFPGGYSEREYYEAWRNVVLWHEHTWGAWNSISKPDDPNVIRQWEYKRDFALQADSASRRLLQKQSGDAVDKNGVLNILNTSSWNRTDIVSLTKEQSSEGDIVVDEKENHYPSQRLSDGRLIFLAKDIPALGSKQFYNRKGNSSYTSDLKVSGNNVTENGLIKMTIDSNTGAIKSLVDEKSGQEFVDVRKYKGLNQYLYMPGRDPSKAISVRNVEITVKEAGPLVVTFQITAKAPGTNALVQEVSLINELNKIEINNIVDKAKITEKESVHFAFPVALTGGQMKIDMGTGILIPGKNQLQGSNNDYISMQRWIDVSNEEAGLTFITPEVPLVEQGQLVNELSADSSQSFGGQSVEKKWKEHNDPSNTFFSYAMNNYWYTNYKACQEGKVKFHYAIYLHGRFNAAEANRQGREEGQPLLISANANKVEVFELNDENILLTSVKPAVSGKGTIMRFYNASSLPQQLKLKIDDVKTKMYLSNAKEEKLAPLDLKQQWPAFSVATVYLE